jgi:uncharacterized protein YbaR (Trm112 family)
MNKSCPYCKKNKLVEINNAKHSDATMKKLLHLKSNIVKLYPRQNDQIRKTSKCYKEHRFYCNNCKKEFTIDTQINCVDEVPSDSQFIYDPIQKLLVERNE